MCSDIAIKAENLGKCYQIYNNPQDRLKQSIVPRLYRAVGKPEPSFYKEFWALRDVSFQVGRGETVGIIGRNGSGKSTLLQIICGTLNPTDGQVRTHGRIAALLELGSGFNPEFTGRENVYMNAALLGLRKEQIDARYDDIVAFADIGDFIHQPTKTYSSGMMVRLAFAVIAHVDADILVIDEALAVGDAFFTQKCMRFLREFMATKTVLFVSHDLGAVKNLCSSTLWIDRGHLRYAGDSKKACDLYLEELFGQAKQPAIIPPALSHDSEKITSSKKDARSDLLDRSTLRNDIHVFEFDPSASAFHTGECTIESVRLIDSQGNLCSYIVGGEAVCLEIVASCSVRMESPIVGFYIKDRLGQNLFGDNTWLTYCHQRPAVNSGQKIVAQFIFDMPRLMIGNYSITVAIASGTQQDFVQHHWIHDALHFTSQTTSVAGGLIGLPMQHIELKILTSDTESAA